MTSSPSPGINPADLARTLLDRSGELADRLTDRIVAEDRFYSDSEDETRDLLRGACLANLELVLEQLAGGGPLRTGAARSIGQTKAGLGAPLEAVTHAFRTGGRFIWETLVAEAGDRAGEALLHTASDIWSIIDAYSEAATDAYRASVEDLAARDARTKERLLAALLDGEVRDSADLWESSRTLRIPRHGTFLVATAEAVDSDGEAPPGEETLPCVEERLAELRVRSVWRTDGKGQVGLLSLPSAEVLPAVRDLLAGLAAARLGLSASFTGLTQAGDALRQAQLAAWCSPPRTRAVVRYEDVPLQLLLVRQPDVGRDLADRVLGGLPAAGPERDTLLETLEAWYASGGSTSAAAQLLYCHRNTVLYRLRRVEELTGRSVNDPVASAELYAGLQAVRLLPGDAAAGVPAETAAAALKAVS
ncbi:PucR family transcriptional regulator [Streptomyces atratus]|uniref:PucR family transcriptional regulator n=1 Tax=Streptomyces atratus TaxID=1893 RepID=UPI0033F269ED